MSAQFRDYRRGESCWYCPQLLEGLGPNIATSIISKDCFGYILAVRVCEVQGCPFSWRDRCHAGGQQSQGKLAGFWGCWLQPLEPALTYMPCTSCRSSSRSLSSQCRYPHALTFFKMHLLHTLASGLSTGKLLCCICIAWFHVSAHIGLTLLRVNECCCECGLAGRQHNPQLCPEAVNHCPHNK